MGDHGVQASAEYDYQSHAAAQRQDLKLRRTTFASDVSEAEEDELQEGAQLQPLGQQFDPEFLQSIYVEAFQEKVAKFGGTAAMLRAQEIQSKLIHTNYRQNKSQRRLVNATERITGTRSWPIPGKDFDDLYGTLYPLKPPVRQRCVMDDFATAGECRHVVDGSVRIMYKLPRMGVDTSWTVKPELLEVQAGNAFAQLICGLLERTRKHLIQNFGVDRLFLAAAMITRLEGEGGQAPPHGEMPKDIREHWSPHIDKANVASYDYGALLYLSTQGEDFDGVTLRSLILKKTALYRHVRVGWLHLLVGLRTCIRRAESLMGPDL